MATLVWVIGKGVRLNKLNILIWTDDYSQQWTVISKGVRLVQLKHPDLRTTNSDDSTQTMNTDRQGGEADHSDLRITKTVDSTQTMDSDWHGGDACPAKHSDLRITWTEDYSQQWKGGETCPAKASWSQNHLNIWFHTMDSDWQGVKSFWSENYLNRPFEIWCLKLSEIIWNHLKRWLFQIMISQEHC